ncbi:MAG: hypothetical protein LAP85_18500 [Acidobacteriia bacterium]|nr:hypothetical protein [Terriglobia bacterium]
MPLHRRHYRHLDVFLKITLDAIQDSSGSWDRVSTTKISVVSQSHEKQNGALIGGGAAVGAVIGAIAGGGKGAAIGAASGADAGTAGAYAAGRKNAAFSAEKVLKFRTTSEIAPNQ